MLSAPVHRTLRPPVRRKGPVLVPTRRASTAPDIKPKRYWHDANNRKLFVKALLSKVGGKPEAFYGLTQRRLVELGASGILNYYRNSPPEMFMAELPEFKLQAWRFHRSPKHFWIRLGSAFRRGDPNAIATVKEYLEDLATTKLKLGSLREWENVSLFALGSAVTDHLKYIDALPLVLQRIYPNHQWFFKSHSRQTNKTDKRWIATDKGPGGSVADFHDPRARRLWLEAMAPNIKSTGGTTSSKLENLRNLSMEDLVRSGGEYLYHKYDRAIPSLVSVEFPEYAWLPWHFRRPNFGRLVVALAPGGDPVATALLRLFLEDKDYSTEFIDSTAPVRSDGLQALKVPTNAGEPRPGNFWKDPAHRRQFFSKLMKPHGNSYQRMYSITYNAIIKAGGASLLAQYYASASMAIMDVFPEHLWQPWKFAKAPSNWWADLATKFADRSQIQAESTVRQFMEDVAAKCGVERLTDWHSVTLDTWTQVRVNRLGGLAEILRRLHPRADWSSFSNSYPGIDTFVGAMVKIEVIPFRGGAKLRTNFWMAPVNQWTFFQHLKSQCGNTYDSLYAITVHHIFRANGSLLLSSFPEYMAPDHLIKLNYPDHGWKPWQFEKLAQGWRASFATLITAHDPVGLAVLSLVLEQISQPLNVGKMEDWYTVALGAMAPTLALLLKPAGGLPGSLALVYPHHQWKPQLFSGISHGHLKQAKQQRSLANKVDNILPT